MTSKLPIHYSRGTNKYDNQPMQLVAKNFDRFESTVLSDRSKEKGQAYISAPLAAGLHYQNPSKYIGKKNWRLVNHVLPRAFLSFDLDWFKDPQAFQNMKDYLSQFRGFGYTTASSTPENPRARAILMLDKSINREEGICLGSIIQHRMTQTLGEDLIQFDSSVYKGEQPIYTPIINSECFSLQGDPVNVEYLLDQKNAEFEILFMQPGRIRHLADTDINRELFHKYPPPDESPRQIGRIKNMLTHISADCDYDQYRLIVWAILSTGWKCASDLAKSWSQTAPNRFNEQTFNTLLNNFNPNLANCPTLGSIQFLAQKAGWHE